MNILNKYTSFKLLLFSLICAVFIIYPDITFFSYLRNYFDAEKHNALLLLLIFKYVFFSTLIWLLILYNLYTINTAHFGKRFFQTLFLALAAYLLYSTIIIVFSPKPDWHSGLLLLQFFVIFIFCSLIGQVYFLYVEQRKKEQEIEQLKTENLRSRYDALTSQINPHFFFNSLNGLSSLIRKKNEKNALEYMNKMSDVFRYILQSEKKGLVSLEEELEFVKAFQYMMEIRFANKLVFRIDVSEDHMDLKTPVLSLLPLIDNVVIHNIIDSEHKMEVTIHLNDRMELVISNPVFPKLSPPDTNGTGLINLENRFSILMNKQIRIENDGKVFRVYLPLR